ncbi:MAG: type II toxin-antitoxin system PemK/MazF family toxin [Candidatus Thorarchaeota archaeon]|nr:type II toxin-antitoxin system PemK/MazF family toxin [Candidatus Thorarchaeota archaeon]
MSLPQLHKVGDIVHVDLEPIIGHEQEKRRPCITVSVPTQQRGSTHDFGILIVVPLTSKRKNWWTAVGIPRQVGLDKDSYALCHQIRSISTKRVSNTSGSIGMKDLVKIRLVLTNILSLP